jgi:L,D-transpeptidase YcbB
MKRSEVVMLAFCGLGARRHFSRLLASVAVVTGLGGALSAEPQITPFSQSVAVTAAQDDEIAAIYAARGYAPIWTGAQDAARRQALLTVLAGAGDHGLPVARYDPQVLIAAFQAATTEGDRGRVDVTTCATCGWV